MNIRRHRWGIVRTLLGNAIGRYFEGNGVHYAPMVGFILLLVITACNEVSGKFRTASLLIKTS